MSKIESILGTRMSQNLSRDRRLACGILQRRMPVEEALALLGALPEEFTEALLPGATYQG